MGYNIKDLESLEVSVGLDDTHDGVKLGIDDEDYWRIHLTPQGQILMGDGSEIPTALSVPSGDNVWSGSNTFEHGLYVNTPGTAALRQPFQTNANIDGSKLTGSGLLNKAAHALGVNFYGGFTHEGDYPGLPDPYFLFGANDYILTGTSAGDIAGVTNLWGRLTETHNRTPGSDLADQRSLVVQAYIDHASAHSDQVITFNSSGASGIGSTDLAINAYFESPVIGTTRWNIYAAGGAESYFEGHINLADKTLNTHNGAVSTKLLIVTDDGGIPGGVAHATFRTEASLGAVDIIANASQTADLFFARESGGTKRFRLTKNGTIVTSIGSAPADADLVANEMAFWFDHSNGAAKLMLKGRTADSTIVTGQVALA